MSFFSWISTDEGQRVVAGIAGGTVSSLFNWEGPIVTVRKLIIGALMAWALAPTGELLLLRGLSLVGIQKAPYNSEFAAAFLLGTLAMLLIETAGRTFRTYMVLRHDKKDQ